MAENANHGKVTLTNGHGILSRSGVTVGKGVEATAKVHYKVKTLTEQQIMNVLQESKSSFSKEGYQKLEENHAAGGLAAGMLLGAFGLLFGGGTYNHYKDASNKEIEAKDANQKAFLEKLRNVQEQEVIIDGDVKAVGTSFIEVTGFVFVETTSIRFADDKTLTVFNTSNPIVADQNGETKNIQTGKGGLHVVTVP